MNRSGGWGDLPVVAGHPHGPERHVGVLRQLATLLMWYRGNVFAWAFNGPPALGTVDMCERWAEHGWGRAANDSGRGRRA